MYSHHSPSPTPQTYPVRVTKGLYRYYGTPDVHFIAGSCIAVSWNFGVPERRDRFLKILEEARLKYRFVAHGYVIMPEHFHLLITLPEVGDPSIMKVIRSDSPGR
jgi:hypothetical protein